MAVWLQVKVHHRGLELQSMYVGSVCDNNAAEVAFVSLRE